MFLWDISYWTNSGIKTIPIKSFPGMRKSEEPATFLRTATNRFDQSAVIGSSRLLKSCSYNTLQGKSYHENNVFLLLNPEPLIYLPYATTAIEVF